MSLSVVPHIKRLINLGYAVDTDVGHTSSPVEAENRRIVRPIAALALDQRTRPNHGRCRCPQCRSARIGAVSDGIIRRLRRATTNGDAALLLADEAEDRRGGKVVVLLFPEAAIAFILRPLRGRRSHRRPGSRQHLDRGVPPFSTTLERFRS